MERLTSCSRDAGARGRGQRRGGARGRRAAVESPAAGVGNRRRRRRGIRDLATCALDLI
uniref:Uncharacterized protein n=1 Tax=Triticum urartu TaxID=4572 RepID=A0A8R7UMZ2_TRIUA